MEVDKLAKENGKRKIVASFLIFIALFIGNLFVPISGSLNATNRMWLVLDVCVLVISIALLMRNYLPAKRYTILSLIFGLLMFAAYQGISFSSVKGSIITTLCSLASFRIFEKYPDYAIPFLKTARMKSIALGILIGISAGGFLGMINLGLSNQPLNFNLNIACFLTALSPAILEEVCYRLLVFAFCLWLLRGEIKTRSENFWCYFMMVVPHVLIHTPDIFLNYGVISGLINSLILTLIFGLPFAFLQRKRDLISAMTAHGMVDVIRFAFLGLPF